MQGKVILAGLGLALGMGAICWHTMTSARQGVPAVLARPAQAAMPGSALQRSATALVAALQAPQEKQELPLGTQVEQLIATHDAGDAYAVYWLIVNCETFNREHERAIYDIEEARQNRNFFPFRAMTDSEKQRETRLCSGMTERMRLSRFDYLATAVKAGVSGALMQMVWEGPFGDSSALTTRPDDPLVQEWKAAMLERLEKSADSGDMVTLNYLWVHEQIGDALVARNPALAYRHGVALGLVHGEINGPSDDLAAMFAPEGQMMTMALDLTPEQRAAERAAAQRIVDKARAQREQGNKQL